MSVCMIMIIDRNNEVPNYFEQLFISTTVVIYARTLNSHEQFWISNRSDHNKSLWSSNTEMTEQQPINN